MAAPSHDKPECVDYFERVLDGRIVACRRLKQLAAVMLERIEKGYKGWHFDYARANKPVRFIEQFCKLPSGKLGKPFKLELFQKACVQVMFGFVDDDGLRQFHEVLWVIGRKNGKALSLNTPIPTPAGWKLMEDIHPGDYVFGKDGKPVKVLFESEVFDKPMYRVYFEDGATVNASADHIWTVQTKRSRRVAGYTPRTDTARPAYSRMHDGGWFETTTEAMKNDLAYIRADGKGVEYKYRVPMCEPVAYPEASLPIHPYVLGVWLGDGTSRKPEITASTGDAGEIAKLIEECGYPVRIRDYPSNKHRVVTLQIDHRARGTKDAYDQNSFNNTLKRMGLKGNKHIPDEYLTASIEQRWELLKGLMDTDGYCSKSGECQFVQKSRDMAMQFAQLCASLGIKATVRGKHVKCNGKDAGIAFSVLFFTDKAHPCFKMKRKAIRLKDHLASRMQAKSIVKIERIPNQPSKCIAVDDPWHIYLAGKRYTATHNTSLGSALELYMLLADGEGAPQVYNAATSKPQASLAYGNAVTIMERSAALRKRLRKGTVVKRKEDGIICDANSGYITPLSSQTRHLDGLDVHFALFDELAACTNRDQYDLIDEGMSAREQPMMLCITTNGFERGNIFDDRYEYGCGILDGTIDDDRVLPIIYELDDRDEWRDETCWVKANPGIGPIKKWEALRKHVNQAEQNPSKRPSVLTKDFNVPENQATAWLTFEEATNPEPLPFPMERNPEMPRGERFRYGIAGFDASDTTDLSAACVLMMRPGDDRIYKVSMYWLPEDSLRDDGLRTERDDVPYRAWEKRGLIRLVEGNKVPKRVFIDWLDEVKREYDVWTYALGYDPWRIYGTDEEMLQQYVGKRNAEEVRQGSKTFSDPMKELRADYAANRIVDGGNPMDAWCRMNVSVKADDNDNIRPVKAGGKAKNRIDGFMAELDAYVALMRHWDDYMAVI